MEVTQYTRDVVAFEVILRNGYSQDIFDIWGEIIKKQLNDIASNWTLAGQVKLVNETTVDQQNNQ